MSPPFFTAYTVSPPFFTAPLDNDRRLCYHIPQDYNEEADNLRFLMHFHQKMPVVRTYIA